MDTTPFIHLNIYFFRRQPQGIGFCPITSQFSSVAADNSSVVFQLEPPSPGWGPALHDSVPSLESALVVKMYCSLIQAQSQQEQMVGVYRDGDVTVSISGAPLASAEHVKKMKRTLFSASRRCIVCLHWRVAYLLRCLLTFQLPFIITFCPLTQHVSHREELLHGRPAVLFSN